MSIDVGSIEFHAGPDDAGAPDSLLVVCRGFDEVVSGQASPMTLELTPRPTRVNNWPTDH